MAPATTRPPRTANTAPAWISERAEIGAAIGFLGVLAIMIVPVHPAVLDILLTMSLSAALLVLLLTVYVERPVELSVFPTLLLLLTLFRLALNVASTRLILLHASAGKVIAAFGQFVVGGNYAVGLVAFFILAVIQFVVITRGAGRIAEVAARFTLDAMPGRQMSIDADVNAGLIDETEAQRRRREIASEADFYGAMDGAAKFVRGDAVAGMIITLINIVGGFVVGMAQHGMSMGEAARTYTLLTVGDGLVAQIPALITSTASAIIVARSSTDASVGKEIAGQVLDPRALLATGGVLGALALVPGLPALPFLVLAALTAGLGFVLRRAAAAREAAVAAATPRPRPEIKTEWNLVDPLELEVGYGLIPLVDERNQGDLLDRVTLVRREIGFELGLPVPPVRIRDNVRLGPQAYRLKVHGVEVGRGEILLDHCLAIPGAGADPDVDGISTTDPVFGLRALWVPRARRERAEAAGYSVVEPAAVIATHLAEVVRGQAPSLLGRQETRQMLDEVKKTMPALVDDLVPAAMSLGAVQQVLRDLLRERVSIRDLRTILETLADHAPAVKDVAQLVEAVRLALGPALYQGFEDERGRLRVIALDPAAEEEIEAALRESGGGSVGAELARRLYAGLREAVQVSLAASDRPVLLVAGPLRRAVRDLVAPVMPQVTVLAIGEVARRSTIHPVATLRLAPPGAGARAARTRDEVALEAA